MKNNMNGDVIKVNDYNGKEFDVLFRQFHAPLTYFAYSLVKDRQVAEDIVEDCFIKLWERQDVFSRPGSIKSYLYTSVRNACIDEKRTVKRMNEFSMETFYTGEKEELPVSYRIIEAETMHMIFQAMEALPPKCGLIFKMYYLEGKKLHEIAEELKLSLSTVKCQKARALEILRKKLPHFSAMLLFLHLN